MKRSRVQAVVVLYRTSLRASHTGASLIDFARRETEIAQLISLLIYDNSADSNEQAGGDIPGFHKTQYIHDPSNGGLAAAYGKALDIADSDGIEWLLLLDQDTSIPVKFFEKLILALDAPPHQNICAIVPRLVRNGELLSPRLWPKALSDSSPRLYQVLNSAACLRVKALRSVGGFPREYWLDYLDHIVFHRLQINGWHIQALDVEMEHELSVKNFAREMSSERYRKLLIAEMRFLLETVPKRRIFAHRLHLLLKSVLHAVQFQDKSYAINELKCAFRSSRSVR